MSNLDKFPLETIVDKIVKEKEDINELNLKKLTQREALLEIVKKRPNIISKINEQNAVEFLPIILKEKPEYFVYVKKEQYTDKITQMYLHYRLTMNKDKSAKQATKNNISVQKSIDEKIIFNYSYTTEEGEELSYYDNELNIPLSLKSNFKISIKLEDSLCFINKMDLHITQLGEHKIKSTLVDLISNRYIKFLSNYIKENKLGYYSLTTSLEDIEQVFVQEISKVFEEYGLSVNSFILRKIAIPADIKNKVEDLAFNIRQRKVNVEADVEFEKLALQNYDLKLSVQQKYPELEHSLTEYEKDLALKRYLMKNGRLEEEEIDREIEIDEEKENLDSDIKLQEDIIPEEEKSKFKSNFIAAAVICLIFSIILMFSLEKIGVGLIVLGVFVAIFGLIAAFHHEKFNSKSGEKGEK